VVTLSCIQARDSLLDFVEGALEPEMRQNMEDHLRQCAPCDYFLETYRETSMLCCRALKREMPAGFSERLLATLREKTTSGRRM
jgi:hypothetical protein